MLKMHYLPNRNGLHPTNCLSTKTSHVIASKLKTVPGYLNTIHLGDMMIKRVHHGKYLGPILDESLSFKGHIDVLSKQLNKLANSYKIIKYRVERDNKYNIYFAYTYSKMLHRIEVYGNACNEYINKLQVQQNRSLKIV